MNRSLKLSTLLALLILTTTVFGQYPSVPQGQLFVHDYANLLSNSTEKTVRNICTDYEKQTTIEMVVVTVEAIHKIDPDEYATTLASRWGVGKATLNNGVFLLIAKKERKAVVKPGDGLVYYYSKEMSDAIGGPSVMLPFLRQETPDFDGAVIAAVNKIKKQLGPTTWNMREEHRKKLEEEAFQRRQQDRKIELELGYKKLKERSSSLTEKAKNTHVQEETGKGLARVIILIDWEITENLDSEFQSLRTANRALDTFEENINFEIRQGEKAEKAIKQKETITKIGVILFVLLLFTLFTYFVVRWIRKEELRKKLNDQFHKEILSVANKLDAFFLVQYKIPDDVNYPEWAKQELVENLNLGIALTSNLYEPVNQLGALIDSDPFTAESNMKIEGLKELKGYYELITKKIPNLVRMYRDNSPDLLLEASNLLEKEKAFFETIQKRGFDFSEEIILLKSVEEELEELNQKMKVENVVYRDIYTHTKESIENIKYARTSANKEVAAFYYVKNKTPDLEKYLKTIEDEFNTTQSVWLNMKEQYPTSAYDDLIERFNSVDERFGEVQQLISRAVKDNSFTEQDFTKAKSGIDDANNTLQWIDDFLDLIRDRKADLVAAKKTYFTLYDSTKKTIDKMVKKAKHSDVSSTTKNKAKKLEEKFNVLEKSPSNVDWISLTVSLKDIKKDAQTIFNKAKNQIAKAKQDNDWNTNYSTSYKPYKSPLSTYSPSRSIGGGLSGGGGYGGGGFSRGTGSVSSW